MELEKIQINDEFKKCIELIDNTDKNLFITGKAGTGKSTLLEYFCKNTKKPHVVLAPTGIAALNVKGQTIHKFFNFYIDVTPQRIKDRKTKPKNPKFYKKLKTIIIDEVSMLRADLLDCIDVFLRMYGSDSSKPFGGVQMIFIGDLYQLPPVVPKKEQHIFTNHYKTPYFFSANVFNQTDMFNQCEIEILELNKIYRQKDQCFINLLNKIRNNIVDEQDIIQLNQRKVEENKTSAAGFCITLTTTNRQADETNNRHLQKLAGKMYNYEAQIKGSFTKEYFPTAINLQFKQQAQVMMLNNDKEGRWFNGTIGIVECIGKNHGKKFVRIKLENGEKVNVYRYTWEIYNFTFDGKNIISEPIGTFEQFPFRLAWAVTIHKSQGKTFENVIIDIGWGAFASGQTYVALSRCTSFEGITLKTPIKRKDIICDARINNFMRGQL